MSPPSTPGRPWRRYLAVAALVAVVVVAVLAGALWLYADHLYRTSYDSSYSYDVVVNTNETLDDVTVYLPIPAESGRPNLAAPMVEAGNGVGDNFTYDVVRTEYGPMLRLTADHVNVTTRYYEFVEENGTGRRVPISETEYDPANPDMTRDANAGTLVTVYVPANETVSTADPWGVEPMFSPRLNRRPADCGYPVGDWLRCWAYDTKVYASYETNETARVDLITHVEGQNAWWIFGWSYDQYRDEIQTVLRGPQDGWTDASGTVRVDTEQRRPPRGAASLAAADPTANATENRAS